MAGRNIDVFESYSILVAVGAGTPGQRKAKSKATWDNDRTFELGLRTLKKLKKMVKAKGKRVVNIQDGTNGVDHTHGDTTEDASMLPQFPDISVANLTKRIEQKLKGRGKEDEAGEKSTQNVKPKPSKIANSKERGLRSENQQAPKANKKRDRSGKPIVPHTNENRQSSNSTHGGRNKSLEDEIYSIGGTKEDLDLIAGVESDSEMEDKDNTAGTANNLDKLRKDLGKLINGGDSAPAEDKPKVRKPQREVGEKSETTLAKPHGSAKKLDNTPAKPHDNLKNQKEKVKPSSRQDKRNLQKAEPSPSKPTIPVQSDWFAVELPAISYEPNQPSSVPRHVLDEIREYAMALLEAENNAFASSKDYTSSSSYKFYSTIVSSGTLSDKISALTLSVQESPLHNVKALESLIGLAKKRNRTQAVEVLRSLKDLFAQGTLLPSDRRLKFFTGQPALTATMAKAGANWKKGDPLPKQLEKSHLIVWAFEDFIKEQYFEILKILEIWCNDEIEFSRTRAVSYVFELLKEKPEQEANLLRLLVNKLGDPSKKISSQASYLLLQLQQTHPLMKATIISSIEAESLFRPGQSQHAKYYSVITLNQTILSSGEDKVAAQLLDIYFPLFVTLLKSKKELPVQKKNKEVKPTKKGKSKPEPLKGESQEEELREKLISAVLTGVNRAYPFTTSSFELLSKHMDTLFRITHSSNFNTSIQALVLIQQLTSSHAVSADRFYRTLYESLLDPRIATSSKQSMYLNLLFKALKADVSIKRVKAFVKRLLQILGLHNPSFICGILFLIRELESTFPALMALVDQPEDPESDEEEDFRDVPEDGEEVPEREESKKSQNISRYDSRKRDPEESNADKSCLWEILPYQCHFHPSVAVGARQLLLHEKMSGKPDLTIHTLTHFLDRFVYRTPKASAGLRGSSIMQPLAGGDTSGLLVTSGRSAKTEAPVNTEAFWRKRSDDVAAEDVFFHQYFNRLGKDKLHQKAKKKTKGDDSEAGSDSEEDEVWKALVQSQPDIDGGIGSDDDLDMDGFESAMNDSGDELVDEDMNNDREIDDDVIINEDSGAEDDVSELGEDDTFDMDVSDNDAFRESDEDIPSDLAVDTEQEEEEDEKESGKRASRKEKRRKLKHLPTFASVDDYAALLGEEDSGTEL
ncbi:hypothetical protein FQN57_003819 [Myotisia sp. PD_48]|nr:hypothetical protein FQN57_003819 [Myotisia sp. PD_48]